jgi:hypothetical protein
VGFQEKLTMEQLTRLPPATLALELLKRIPERGAVRRVSLMSAVLFEASPRVPGQSVVRSEHVMHEHPAATMSTRRGLAAARS